MKEISDGVYLYAKDDIIAEQKTWDEEDNAKKFDFTTSEFWLVTDDGIIEPAEA